MIVSITEFATLAKDIAGQKLPLGQDRLACNVRVTNGKFPALHENCRFIRVATDTAILMDIEGGQLSGVDELFVADSVEYIAVTGGEVLEIVTAVAYLEEIAA